MRVLPQDVNYHVCATYNLDDILVIGSAVDNNLLNLDKVLNILATADLKINKTKCAF